MATMIPPEYDEHTTSSDSLLYVGMSHARSLPVMMVHERVRESIGTALLRKLSKERQS